MEQTDIRSFERLTGLAFFTPSDGADAGIALPFGNITMLKLQSNPKTVEVSLAKRGKLNLAKRDTYQVSPLYEIHSNQFSSPTFPLQLMGDRLSDVTQSSGTAATYTFTAKAGRAYRIGAKNITIANVKVAAATKTLGVDYFVDDPTIPQVLNSLNGYIILPVTPAGIADGDTVVVTYDKPAITREQYAAFSKLNRSGSLVVIAEDESGADPREEWTMQVQISAKGPGDIDPTKFREVTLEAALFGSPIVTRKP